MWLIFKCENAYGCVSSALGTAQKKEEEDIT